MALTDVKSEQIQSSVALAGSPTTTTQSASDNSTKIATTAYVETAVANLVASAPAALNTLDELAAALNDDASFSTTVTNSIATKLPLAGGTMTGSIALSTSTGIKANTSDGSDNAVLFVSGGGDNSDARGGKIRLYGNEHSSLPGRVEIAAGNVTDNTITFLTSATERMRITSAGLVGIGTTSPGNYTYGDLVIDGSTGSGNASGITLVSTSASYGGIFFADGTSGDERYRGFLQYNHNYSSLTDTFLIGTSGATRMVVDANGLVGIGTTTPSSFNSLADDLVIGATTGSTGITIVGATNGHSSIYLADGATGASQQYAGYMQYAHGSDALIFGTSATERLRILSDGKVGIGTNNPGKSLVIDSSNADPGLLIIKKNSGNNVAYIGTGSSGATEYGIMQLMHAGSTDVQLYAEGDSWINGGNLGIGTTSPASGVGTPLTLQSSTGYVGLRLNGTGSAAVWDLYSSYSGGVSMFGIYDRANTRYNLVTTQNNNVGIGTETPASWSKLHISASSGGNPNTANQALYIQAPEQTAGQGVSLRMSAASGSKEAVGIIGVVNNASGNAGSMTFHTYNLGATIPEYMRLTNQGYLGIGETNPVAKLTVKGANDTNFEVQPDLSSGVNRITNFNRVNSTYKTLRVDASQHQFYVSGNPKVTINTSGIMTQESLPAFNAYYNGNVYSPNNNTLFEHNATRFDNGSNFNTTYHRFTAPVAGVYHFYFRTIIYGAGNNGHISFRKNGTTITGGNGHYSSSWGTYWHVWEMHTIQDMAANDYIDVYNNSRTATYYHGNTWNEFSGYLVG